LARDKTLRTAVVQRVDRRRLPGWSSAWPRVPARQACRQGARLVGRGGLAQCLADLSRGDWRPAAFRLAGRLNRHVAASKW